MIRHELHYGTRLVRCYADRPAHVDALLRDAAARDPAAPALQHGGTYLDYAALDGMVDRLAANLLARLQPGDRVAMLLGNGVPAVLLILACARAGLVLVAMNTRQRAPETEYMLRHSGAAALVHEPGADLPAVLPAVRACVGGPAWNALLRAASAPMPAPHEDDAFCLLYTSGTTGRPKGAVLTHLGVVHSCLAFEAGLGLRRFDRAVLAVPASHVTGLIAIVLASVRVAGCILVMDAFKAGRFLELVARERATYALMVPAMYNLCLLDPGFAAADLSSWRVGGFGGAPMPPATVATLAAKLPGLVLHNVYGATETTSPATMLPAGAIATHPDSVGVALPCCDIRVMDEHGVEVAPGQPGELWIAGPNVVPRYWQDEVATARGFVHGHWRSGDIGSVDADGFVRVFDRQKDMINRGGFKIYSVEVEAVLSHMPGVLEAAVVGRPCPVLGERVAAFVSADDPALTADAIRAFCAARLSDYKVPEFVTVGPEPLPRNPNGKLLKGRLRG